MVPIVLSVIPTVPGGRSGTTVTGQLTPSSSDSAAGEINFFTIGSAIPKAPAERHAYRVEVHVLRHRLHIAGLHSA